MRRTSGYFINLLLVACTFSANAQDSLNFPLKIRIGADVYGPASYLYNKYNLVSDKKSLGIEGYLSLDIDTQKAAVIEAGYLDFMYTQYNYNYQSKGYFVKIGVDFNLIHPEQALGRYYAGIGLRYGFSIFKSEVPVIKYKNYWGSLTSSVPPSTSTAHFIEASPGIKAEVFRNFSMGWIIRLRFLIYSGTGKDLKAISIPGFGDGVKVFSPGINYYLIVSIPYKNQKLKSGIH
jgi:hypothetical protein